jgi:hypothetical protein
VTKLSKSLLKASFAGTYAETMLTPLYAGLTNQIGGTLLDAGVGYAMLNLTTGIVVILIGRTLWFEVNINWMVFWGFTMAGLCDLLYLLVRDRWQFFAVQIMLGLAVGLLNPAWDALYSDDDDETQSRAKKWSFWTGGVSFVIGASALTGALVTAWLGFKSLFVLMALCDLVAIYYSWQVAKHADE